MTCDVNLLTEPSHILAYALFPQSGVGEDMDGADEMLYEGDLCDIYLIEACKLSLSLAYR